jgi:hypothetical protein
MRACASSELRYDADAELGHSAYHYIRNDWHPIDKTEESLVEMFERRPEGGKHVRHRCGPTASLSYAD